MRFLLALFMTCIFVASATAQSQYLSAKDSDPAAKKILDKLKKDYNSYKSLEVDFELILELPGAKAEKQKGFLKQSGESFVAKVADQEIFCNGKAMWLYLKGNNEVQINDYKPGASSDFLSPKDMLRMYERKDMIYAIAGEEVQNGVKVTLIEFKSTDKKSEYSKMRLAVDKTTNKPKNLKIFSKDGSKYTLNIVKLTPNKTYPTSTFDFNKSKYPGVRIEDLRLD